MKIEARTWYFSLAGVAIVAGLVIAALLIFTNADKRDDIVRAEYKQWEVNCLEAKGFVLREGPDVLCVDKKRYILNVWPGPVWPYTEGREK